MQKKRKNLNHEALERIKDIYGSYIESSDCAKIGNISEVIEADKQLHNLIQNHVPKEYFAEAEDSMTEYANCAEMQGFIYGFSCAMRLMAQSL